MGLGGAILKRLAADASGFVTKNHGSYLAEALACIRETGDALDALHLLYAMWDSSHASRLEQKSALNDVGRWLEERLYREPRVDTDLVALELGWLRRLSRIAAASREQDGERERVPHGAPPPHLAFGKRIARITELRVRRSALPASPRAVAAPAPAAAPPPPPTTLPRVFQAEFVSFADARKARRTARERAQAGKPPKDRLLEIRPTDPRFLPLAVGLVCSVMQTEGFDNPFIAAEQTNGAECRFFVKAIEERDGKKVARAIALTAPLEENDIETSA